MAAHATTQYRPVSTAETSGDDALSVRVYNDLADAENNAKFYSHCHKLRSQIFFPPWKTLLGSTDEHVMLLGAPVEIPDGYNYLLWTLGHQRIAGSDSITWKLYCTSKMYAPDSSYSTPFTVFNSAYLSSDAWTNSIATTSDSHTVEHSYLKLINTTGGTTNLFLILTAESGGSGTQGIITTLDVKPVLK